jgi:hypothetical protein
MTFNTDIEKTEGEIKVLQAKLELLKEMEKHKSPVEEAYKDWWGQYPELETDSEYDDMRWNGFRAGLSIWWCVPIAFVLDVMYDAGENIRSGGEA